MVIYLGSVIQLCCGEGGTQYLQINIAGMCGECSQYMGHTGFAPAHSGLCFLGLHSSGSRFSAGVLFKADPVFRACLSCSGVGSRVLCKGTDSVRHAFCALPVFEQLRRSCAW